MKKFKNTLFTITLVTIAMLSVGCVRKMTEEEKYHPSEVLSEEMEGTSEQELEYKAEYAEKDGFYCLDGDFSYEGSSFCYRIPQYYDKSWERSIDGYVITYYDAETTEIYDYKEGKVTNITEILKERPELEPWFPLENKDNDSYSYIYDDSLDFHGVFTQEKFDYKTMTPYDFGWVYMFGDEAERYKYPAEEAGFEAVYCGVHENIDKEAFKKSAVGQFCKKLRTEMTYQDIFNIIDDYDNLSEDEQMAVALFLKQDNTGSYYYQEEDGTPVNLSDYFVKVHGYDTYVDLINNSSDYISSLVIKETE